MTSAIVTIGDEILIGQVVDTNSAWLAENLNLAGIEVREIRSISDRHDDIYRCLSDFTGKVDLVVMTGGLGPTNDDITRGVLKDFFGGNLVESREVLEHIETLFRVRGYQMTEVNRRQAMVPDSCEILENAEGTAPGMWFEKGGTVFVSMPGVPFEMKSIVSRQLIPRLAKMMNGHLIVHRTIMTSGIPESMLAATISDWELALPSNIRLAYLPHPGIVRLRLTAIGDNRDNLNNLLQVEIDKLQKIIPKDIFAYEDKPLEEVVGEILRERSLTLSTAESCTGGYIASLITSIPGSSDYFRGSVVAYANDIKVSELGVDPAAIESHGAVSRQVVEQMAEGVRRKFNTDFSVATSGVAGPSGGTEEKPVGTVWIAVSSPEKCVSMRFLFGGHRQRNIERSSLAALNMLRKIVLKF
jgi:nicotinamide-nucleotide amidase